VLDLNVFLGEKPPSAASAPALLGLGRHSCWMDRSDGIGARDSAAGQVRGRAETTTARGVGWRDPAISWSNGTPMRMPLRRAWSAPRRARSTLASFFSFFFLARSVLRSVCSPPSLIGLVVSLECRESMELLLILVRYYFNLCLAGFFYNGGLPETFFKTLDLNARNVLVSNLAGF
jgi:hypothetical protein